MNQFDTVVYKEELQYFGAMLSSISHEIKNMLAVINENAGLLDDYAMMAKNGRPLDIERLSALSSNIKKQVRRLNGFITDMHHTAKTVTNNFQQVCLVQHTKQIAELLSRKAALRSNRFEVSFQEEPVLVSTLPVLLMHMLWVCLDFSLNLSEMGATINVAIEKIHKCPSVLITGSGNLKQGTLASIMPDAERETVLSSLGATLALDVDEKALSLRLSINQ